MSVRTGITIDKCPICGGDLEATVKEYIVVDEAEVVMHEGKPVTLEVRSFDEPPHLNEWPPEDDRISWYCSSDHTLEQMMAALVERV